MSGFTLKIIALISMLFDHCGYIFYNKLTYANIIGRLAFPIFAFQISEGYIHTKNLKKYFNRLFIFAIISQIPFMIFLRSFGQTSFELNIFFTLILGLTAITVYDKSKNKFLGTLGVIVTIIIGHFTKCDYGWYGVALIFLFYALKNQKALMNFIIITLIFFKYYISYIKLPNIYYMFFAFAASSSLIFINLYNGKKGKNTKYLLYIFYPLHLMLLYALNSFIL